MMGSLANLGQWRAINPAVAEQMIDHPEVATIATTVEKLLAGTTARRNRPRPQKVRQFAEDIWMVAHGFRLVFFL